MQTKDKIKQAFWETLKNNNNIDNITVKEVTSIAHINRSTFYNYYFDMNDLISEVEDEVINKLMENVTNYLKDNELTLESWTQLFKYLFLEYEDNIYFLLIKNNDVRLYHKLRSKFIPLMTSSGLIKNDIEHLDYLIAFMFNSISGLLIRWYENDKDISADELINLLTNLFKNGFYSYINDSVK